MAIGNNYPINGIVWTNLHTFNGPLESTSKRKAFFKSSSSKQTRILDDNLMDINFSRLHIKFDLKHKNHIPNNSEAMIVEEERVAFVRIKFIHV